MATWNRTAETLSRDEYAKIQLEGLRKSLKRVWGNEFYRTRLQKGGVGSPEDVKSLDDLANLPFFTKDDFREAYPLKMNCVDRQDLMEFHMSSGSTGTPVVMAYTKNDLLQWAECMARCYAMAGMEKGDAVQIMPTFGLFNGGFGCYHGARKAQLFTIPASSGNTERQIKLMKDFKTKGFVSVVSYVPRLIEKLDEYRKAVITAIMKSCNSDTRKLKFCVKLCTEKANDKDNYIALENIESQTGRYIGNKILPDGEAVVTKQGYVLFGKLRPYLAKCYVTEQDGCCSGEFLVMDCHKVSARFLQYVLLEQTLVDKINMSTYGTKMPRANWGFVSNQLIPVPSPNEQSEIVTYLDEKCAAIDAAKERHQQLMDKLEEYKKSLIYNAVTGKIEC